MSIDELLHELKIVAEAAEKVGINREVAAVISRVSSAYIGFLVNGVRIPSGTDKSKKTIQRIILAYRQEMQNKKIEIEKVLGK